MAWECTQCGFTLESTNPPRECPECGAPQELLMWVQDEPVEDDEEDDVAEFLLDMTGIARALRVEEFVRFVDQERDHLVEGAFPVPRASSRSPQSSQGSSQRGYLVAEPFVVDRGVLFHGSK